MTISIGVVEGVIRLRDDFTSQLNASASQLEKHGTRMVRAGRQMSDIGGQLTRTLTVPMVAVGAAAVKMATDLNEGMANVATLIPGNTARVAQLRTEIQGLAVDVGKSTTDLSEGLYQTISAFGDTAETLEVLEINARAATAGLSTTLEAIDLTSAVTKGYGDTSAESVQKAADLALMTVRLGQTTFPELAASMGRVIPLAEAVGQSQEDMFAVFATATGVVGGAAEVATQYRGIINALLKPTEDLSKLIAAQGFVSGEAMLRQLGLVDTLELIGNTAKSSGKPITNYIAQIEAVPLALALAGPQADVFREKLQAMAGAAGATDAAFREQTEGVNAAGFAWQQTRAEFEVALQKLGQELLPLFSSFLGALRPVVGGLEGVARGLSSMSEPGRTAVVALAGLTAAAGPVLFVTGQLITAWGTLIATAPRVAAAVRMVTASFAAHAAVLGGAVYLALDALLNQWDQLLDRQREAVLEGAKVLELVAKINRTKIDARQRGTDFVIDRATYEAALKRIRDINAAILEQQKIIDNAGAGGARLARVKRAQAEIARLRGDLKLLSDSLRGARVAAEEAAGYLAKVPPPTVVPNLAEATDGVEQLTGRLGDLASQLKQLRASDVALALRDIAALGESKRIAAIEAEVKLILDKAAMEKTLREIREGLSAAGDDWLGPQAKAVRDRILEVGRAREEAEKKFAAAMQAIQDQAWRNVQDIAADAISNILREGEVDFKALADSILDIFSNMLAELLVKWAVNAAKRLAIERQLAASAAAANSGIMGPTASGGNIGGGGGWAAAVGGWGTVATAAAAVAIVGAIGYSLGWWGSKGPTTGQASFGGAGDLSVTGATGENAGVIQKRLREALKSISDLLGNLDLEIARFNEVIVRKVDKTYEITGNSLVQLTGATSEEINEAIRVMTIRTATFGKSVSAFLQAVIRGSRAITEEQLAAEIEMGRMVEGFGRTDLEQRIVGLGREMDKVFAWLEQQLSGNIEQLGVGLTSTVQEELQRWAILRRELTGEELSPEAQLEIQKAMAAIFNAEHALRIADLKARLADLQATKQINDTRNRLGIDDLNRRRILLGAELGLMRGFAGAAAAIVQAAASALDLQIKAIQDLITGLEAIPEIDLSKIKLPGGKGGGIDQVATDMERLADLLEASRRAELSEYAQAVAAINDKWDDAIPLAHESAELLADIAAARERELAALREQRLLDFSSDVWDFFAGGSSGSAFVDQVNAMNLQFKDLAKQLGVVAKELGLTGFEMLHFFALLEAGRKKIAKQLAVEGFIGLARELADLTQNEQLRHRLLMQIAEVEFDLNMARYRMEMDMLVALGYLTKAQRDLLNDALQDVAANRNLIIRGQVPIPGGGGGGGGPDPADERARALQRLRDIQARALDPFSQAIRSVVDEFAELRRVLGWTAEVQAAYAQEIQRVLREQLEPIRRLQDELAFRSDSPMRSIDQFRLAQQQVHEAQAALRAGDLSRLEVIPDLISRVIDLNPSAQASEATRFLFAWARQALDEAAAAAASAVSGIVPGEASDPWTWLRDTPTAGDQLIAKAIYDIGRDLSGALGDVEEEVGDGTRGIQDRLPSPPFDWGQVGVRAVDPSEGSTGSRRAVSESREIESLQRLRELVGNTSETNRILGRTSIGLRAAG